MASMDESIAWAIENKEWVLTAVCAVATGVFVLIKWLFKKPPPATVSNTASTSGMAAQTISPQASGGGVAFAQAEIVNVGPQVDVNAIVQQLLEANSEKIRLEQELAMYRQQVGKVSKVSVPSALGQPLSDEFVDEKAFSNEIDLQSESEPGQHIDTLSNRPEAYDLQLQHRDDQIKQLTEAVSALAAQQGKPDAPLGLEHALAELEKGNTEEAEAIFQTLVDRKEPDVQQAAEAYRHIGALAFLHDTDKALNAYRRATELDPENLDGWNRYGHLLRRVGNLKEAENAYREVLRLGQSNNDKANMAVAYGNLGNVYQTRGDLDQAEAMYKKALAIDVDEVLGRKEGMANAYGNLGIVYKTRGDLDQTEAMWEQSISLFREIGAVPREEEVQGWLETLAEERALLDSELTE